MAYDQSMVRRDGNVWKRLGGYPLCEVCGVKDVCELRPALSVIGRTRRAEVTVMTCGAFVPVISFTDPQGLDNRFNTFRKGEGWAKRVTVGGRVGLYDLSADRMVGYALVEGVHTGVLADLLSEHSTMNHMMKTVPHDRAPEELHRVLRRAYGTTYAALTERFCVIDMRRME